MTLCHSRFWVLGSTPCSELLVYHSTHMNTLQDGKKFILLGGHVFTRMHRVLSYLMLSWWLPGMDWFQDIKQFSSVSKNEAQI